MEKQMKSIGIVSFFFFVVLFLGVLMTPVETEAALTDPDCMTCHAEAAASPRLEHHGLGIADCFLCHNAGTANPTCITCHGSDFAHFNEHQVDEVAGCASCHEDLNGMFSGIEATHEPTTGELPCFTCHLSNRTDVVATIYAGILAGPADTGADCSSCHTPHDFPSNHNISETGGCASCHEDLNGTLAGIETVHDTPRNGSGSCATCHNSGDSTTQNYINDGVTNSLECSSCHAAHDFADNHTINETAGCASCHEDLNGMESGIEAVHDTLRNGAGSCATCHSSSDATTQNYINDGVANTLQCTSCHAVHDFPSNHDISETAGCASCHEDLNGMESGIEAVHDTPRNGAGSCATCHSSSDATTLGYINDGVPNALQCSSCHAPHDFPSNHDIRETAGCASCHEDLNGMESGIEAVHDTLRNGAGSCATCHSSSDATTQGYINDGVPNALQCSSCHAPHDFPSNHDISETAGCASCHEDLNGMESGIEAVHDTPRNGAGSCATCHASSDGTTLGYITDGVPNALQCTSCHAPHDFSSNHDISETAGCASCHEDLNGMESGIEAVHDTPRNGAGSCATCHNSGDATTQGYIDDGVPNALQCNDCHAPHDFPGNHNISETGGCASCHEDLNGTESGIEAVHDTSRNGAGPCATCHASSDGTTLGFITDGVPNVLECSSCHTPHDFPGNHDISEAGDCASCHEELNGTEAGVEAVHDTPRNGAGSCATCHSSSDATTQGYIKDGVANSLDCYACHTDHTFAVHSDNITEVDGCADCHTALNGTPASVEVVHDTPTNGAGSCATCHNSSRTVVMNAIAAKQPVDCAACHGDFPEHAEPDHSRITVAASCNACHGAVDIISATHKDACATCHSSPRSEVGTIIGNAVADNTIMVNCIDCHGDYTHPGATHSNITNEGTVCYDCHGQDLTPPPANQAITLHQGDCLVCHTSTRDNVVAAITAGKAGAMQSCTSCHTPAADPKVNSVTHHIPAHDNTFTQETVCLDCHVENVATEHYVNRSVSCASCHAGDPLLGAIISSGRSSNPVPQPVYCNSCHVATGIQSHTDEHDTVGVPSVDCEACHDTNVAIEHVDNRLLTCNTCHASADTLVQQTIANGMAGIEGDCYSCHTGTGGHEAAHDMTDTPSEDCKACHSMNVAIEHVTNHSLACTVCHNSSDPNVIAAIDKGKGPNGMTVLCTDCHITVNHSASHNDTNVPEPICENCHDPNVFVEHVTVRNRECDICHNPTYQDVIDQGVANQIVVTCTTCHLTPDHHSNDTARTGYCIACHTDPRPLDNDPQQLACRECHVGSNNFVQTSSPSPSHSYNTLEKIKDFGACFACHMPVPYHAKPKSRPRDCFNSYSEAPGQGTFNIFSREFGGGGENNERNEDCENRERDYRNPPNGVYMFPIVYQGDAMDVPAFDPAADFPPYPHNRINAVGNCGDCHTVGTVVSVTHNNNCIGCHLSRVKTVQNNINWARAGNNINCYDCHGAGGHAADHDMTVLPQTSCDACHDANVVDEHLDNPQLSCATCHDSMDSNVVSAIDRGRNGFEVSCLECHMTADHLSLHAQTNVDQTSCADCHSPNVVTEHLNNQGLDCVDCHESADPDVVATIAGANGPVTCSDCHGTTDHEGAHDNAGPAGGSNCTDCHSANVVTEHVDIRNLACGTCHDNPVYSGQITAGKAGTYQTCEDCHGPGAGDHAAAHNNAGVPSPGCINCHDGNVVVEHVYNRTFTCGTCHDNSSYIDEINDGKNGIFVSCYDCHGTNSHHNTPESQAGDCTFCHADARLDVDPNAPVGQLACAECHGTNQHNNGGPIQDFGACFACHTPAPYHAKPSSRPRDCYSGGPGQGSFNIFSSEFGGGGERNRRDRDCRNREDDYRNPAISFSWVTIFDFFTTNDEWTVPTFGSNGGGTPGNVDTVDITYADHSSRRNRLTVYAGSSMGHVDSMTVNYGSRSYDMDWSSSNNRWQITISNVNYYSTVEVVSSEGGSDTANVQ